MIKLNVIYLKKKNVFNLDLKRLTSEQARLSKGSLFHSRGGGVGGGVATEHARWPYVFMLKFGSSRRQWSLDDRNVFDWSYYLPTKLKIIIF